MFFFFEEGDPGKRFIIVHNYIVECNQLLPEDPAGEVRAGKRGHNHNLIFGSAQVPTHLFTTSSSPEFLQLLCPPLD